MKSIPLLSSASAGDSGRKKGARAGALIASPSFRRSALVVRRSLEHRVGRIDLEVLLIQVGERAVVLERLQRPVDCIDQAGVVLRHRESVELVGRDLLGDLDSAALL